MAGGSVSFTLNDGETLIVPDEDLREIYDTLWELVREPGAVSTAVLMIDTGRLRPYARRPIDLTPSQSSALRHAVALRASR